MATTEITPSPEQAHSKGEDLDVLKLNSQSGHADDAKEVDVSKISSERQPSVPNENTSPAPRRERHTHQVKEEVSSSIAEKELKIRSKAANRGKPAYDRTVKGKQTGASPQGSALGFSTDEQPAAAGPRYLHVGDHVVVCSEHESEHTYAYREAEEVSEGYEEDYFSHYYNIPEDVYRYKVPVEVSKAVVEESCSDNDKPEDTHGHKDSEEVSFAYRAKERVVEMWSEWKSRRVCWLAVGCGLLVVASVIIAGILGTQLTPAWRQCHYQCDYRRLTNNYHISINHGATGDWETLTSLREVEENPGRICPAPTDIQARVISTGQDASMTGEQFAFYDTTTGFVCRKEDQKDNTCLDYGVRFCCPDGAPSQEVWIGLRKDGESWTWRDGSPVTYSNWNPGEPNNSDGWIIATEACVAMYSKTHTVPGD
uniref:C-type lectin domain-containing protein n=1 Tax=Branchiostoma floridae TaxID=7739 RepID=C3ZPM8_BRAFL|eukprot:XP_002589514.1 hypothetical protein BRAFLDRAFT_88385 [Branchiostoma floridae]